MRNEDVIAKAFGDTDDRLKKAFEGYIESEEQLTEHQKRLEEIHEQIRIQQRGSRKHLQ